MKIEIEINKFAQWYCSKCHHVEMGDRPPRSYPVNCKVCGESGCVNRGAASPVGVLFARVTADDEARRYSLCGGGEEYQIYFQVPGWTGRRGFACFAEDPRESCDLDDVEEAAEATVNEIKRRFLYSSSPVEAEALLAYIKAHPDREKWEAEKLRWKASEAERKLYEAYALAMELRDELESLESETK